MAYTLYNKLNKRFLVHPKCGLWYTESLDEVKEMYAGFLDHLSAIKLPEMIQHIAVVDAETKEEINLLTCQRF